MKGKNSFSLLCLVSGLGSLYFRMPRQLPAQAALLVGVWQSVLLYFVLRLVRKAGKDWKSSALVRGLLAFSFLFTASVDLLDLNRFYQSAYPNQLHGWLLGILLLGAAGMMTGGELRTLKHLTRLMFPLLGISLALLTLSCAGLFHTSNLTAWEGTEILREAFSLRDLIPWPEYLALVLWGSREGTAPLFWVPAARTGISAFILTLAELALGDRGARWPAHSLSLLGQLSVFNRLEWIQITVWLLLLMTRLAFLIYLAGRLTENFPWWINTAAIWTGFLCLSMLDATRVWAVQRAVLWGTAGIILIRGLCRWEDPLKHWRSALR